MKKDKGINVLYVAIGFLKYPPLEVWFSTSKPKIQIRKQELHLPKHLRL